MPAQEGDRSSIRGLGGAQACAHVRSRGTSHPLRGEKGNGVLAVAELVEPGSGTAHEHKHEKTSPQAGRKRGDVVSCRRGRKKSRRSSEGRESDGRRAVDEGLEVNPLRNSGSESRKWGG